MSESTGEQTAIAVRPAPWRAFLIAALGGLAFGALAWLSIELTRGDDRVAAVWIPNAVAVAILLRFSVPNEKILLLALWVGNSAANVVSGDNFLAAYGLATSNMLEIAVTLFLVRHWCGTRPDMLDIRHLGRFLLAAAVVAPMLAGSLALLALESAGAAAFGSWLSWTITDGLGMTIIAPAVMIMIDSWRNRRRPTREELIEWGVLTAGGTASTIAIFVQTSYPFLFLAAPIVILHAFRLGALGTAFSVLKIAIIAIVCTSLGTGPVNLATGTLASKLMVLQVFLASAFVIGLPVAAILHGRKRMLKQLEQGKRQLDLLANNITDAVLRYDLSGVCTYASPSTAVVLGAPAETFIGKSPADRTHEDARERILLATHRLLDGSSNKERFTYRRFLDSGDGTPVFIEADCAIALDPKTGQREAIVVSARDVTERVELEALLTRARRHAEHAARAKSEFLANMSHEIRTPMNGVLGFAELMLQSELSPEHRRHTEMIVQSGRSMMLLLNDILDLSKIEAGQIAIHSAPVDLHGLLSECAALHRPNAEKKALTLRFERENGNPALPTATNADPMAHSNWVITDGLRVRQIVLNLIANAVKFTEKGAIHVSYRIGDGQFRVRVLDTGIGISPSRLESIFRPFTQGESDTARRFGGTGLGLTISRQLAQLLGGILEVESEPGVGSCFTLTLPAVRTAPEPEPPSEYDAISIDNLPNDARILLAEDHDVNRMLVAEMLERCGQKVAIAHDGNEAISMVMDSIMRGYPYDLVLMDIQMPGCDGYAATRAIRAEGISPDDLPIIALTANAFPEDVAAARQAGMQAHLTKPLVFADLARTLQRWLPTRITEIGHEGAFGADNKPELSHGGQHSLSKSQVKLPELSERWHARRTEAIEAVRDALERGTLSGDSEHASEREALAGLMHKLAGTAAMFGEAALGEQAAELERGLRKEIEPRMQMRLANELLRLAQEHGDEAVEAG